MSVLVLATVIQCAVFAVGVGWTLCVLGREFVRWRLGRIA